MACVGRLKVCSEPILTGVSASDAAPAFGHNSRDGLRWRDTTNEFEPYKTPYSNHNRPGVGASACATGMGSINYMSENCIAAVTPVYP